MKEQIWVYSSSCEVPQGRDLPPGTLRYAAILEYDGSQYCGWQHQDHSPSVQQAVEQALTKVADHSVRTACAGRTDTGVHATAQVIHFDTQAQRTPRQWLLGINANLPRDVALRWIDQVPASFHARFSARSRRYCYLIANSATRPALLAGKVSWVRDTLDFQAMRNGLEHFVGEHDFSAFRAAQCQAYSPVRHIYQAELHKQGDWLALDVRASGFLHHMVRNIVGTLLAVGRGELKSADVAELLEKRDRSLAPPTATSHGLYLVGISYAPEFTLPALRSWPLDLIAGTAP